MTDRTESARVGGADSVEAASFWRRILADLIDTEALGHRREIHIDIAESPSPTGLYIQFNLIGADLGQTFFKLILGRYLLGARFGTEAPQIHEATHGYIEGAIACF